MTECYDPGHVVNGEAALWSAGRRPVDTGLREHVRRNSHQCPGSISALHVWVTSKEIWKAKQLQVFRFSFPS